MSTARSKSRGSGSALDGRSGRSWRDADLAQKGGPRPSSVRAVVRATTRSLVALRLVEGALLTVAFTCATMAAAFMSGLEAARVDAIVVALGAGVAGGLSWFLEQRASESDVVHRLDRRMRHGGALVTAWEIEADPEIAQQPLARLCVERVLDRLRTREALQALMPSLAPPVLLPLAGATLLGLSLDAARGATETLFLPLDGLADQLDAFSADALRSRREGKIEDLALRELLVAKSGVDILRIELGGGEPPQDGEQRARDLDRSLAELTPLVAGDPELSREIDQLRSRLDALREALEESRSEGPSGAGLGPQDTGAGRGAAKAESSSFDGSADSGAAELASGGLDGTMGDPTGAGQGSGAGSARGVLDQGPVARVWWDRIDDPLVADWVALLREAEQDPGER